MRVASDVSPFSPRFTPSMIRSMILFWCWLWVLVFLVFVCFWFLVCLLLFSRLVLPHGVLPHLTMMPSMTDKALTLVRLRTKKT